MNKLKAAFLYECSTKIRAMCIFYAIQYIIVALIFGMIALFVGSENVGSNVLEVSTIVFVSIMGVLGYKEDFKALIQNGYTRKYIFLSTIYMFVFITGAMALIDTVIGNAIHYFSGGSYFTLYGSLYGYGNFFANWLFLMALYLMFCSLFYLAVLVINKVGKMVSLFIGVALSGIILLIIALFRFVLSGEAVRNAAEFFMKAMGFMKDGTINWVSPIITLLVIGAVLGIGSYAIIHRTELK